MSDFVKNRLTVSSQFSFKSRHKRSFEIYNFSNLGTIFAKFDLKKEDPSANTFSDKPHLLRIFELAVFEGSKTRQENSKHKTGRRLFKANSLLNKLYTDFLIDISDQNTKPLDRVHINHTITVADPKELSFDHFKIDFVNETFLEPVEIPNCVFQSRTRCLKCDTFYVLNLENTCTRCTNTYLNFLDKCSKHPGSKTSKYVSPLPMKQYMYDYESSLQVSKKYRVFTTLNESRSSDVTSFLNTSLISTNFNKNKIVIYEKSINYSSAKVPPVFFYNWVNTLSSDFSSKKVFTHQNQLAEIQKAQKQFTLRATVFDQEKATSFMEDFHNFQICYTREHSDLSDRNFGLESSNTNNKILEMSLEEVYSLIEQERFSGELIVPISLHPGFDSDFVYEAYSPFYYKLLKRSKLGLDQSKASMHVNTLSAVTQHVECKSNCQECSSKISCSKCKEGYYNHNDDCFSCASQCRRCKGSPINCTSCSFEGSVKKVSF